MGSFSFSDSGTNLYTGGTVINAGSLSIGNVSNIGGASANLTFGGTATLAPSAALNFSGGTLTVNEGGYGTITGNGATAFATTTGTGTLRYTSNSNAASLNLGNASGLTGNLEFRLTGNADYIAQTSMQFSSLGDGVGSVLQVGGGQSDSTNPAQRVNIILAGSSAPLVFDKRRIEILPRIASNHTVNTPRLHNNNADVANTWTINTDLSYQVDQSRNFELAGSNGGNNAFNGVISDGSVGGTISFRKDGAGKWILGGNNTYTGSASVIAGTLNIQHANALGATRLQSVSGNNTSLSLGAVTGPANNSTTTPGTVTIANTIASTGVLTLASYTSANVGTLAGAGETVTFSGTGNTTVTGAITPSATTLNLTKSGGGTLLLNGTNTYTGLTSVNAGTLGGTGTIAGSVTVAAAGSLAPGTAAGTLSIGGGLDISAPANGGAGKLKFELGPIAASDKIALTGSSSLTIGGALLDFSAFTFTALAGLQNGTYKLITSGSAITGGVDTIPANLTGPIGAGSGILQITGNDVELVVSGISGGTPYQTWAGGAAFGDDSNGDGVANGLAFLLGATNPNANATGLLSIVSQSGGNLVLTFSMLNAASCGTATLYVQHSSDLGLFDSWLGERVPNTAGISGPVNGVTFNVTPGSPTNSVTATISSSQAVSGKLFGRLEAIE